jgi:hypothetical protein
VEVVAIARAVEQDAVVAQAAHQCGIDVEPRIQVVVVVAGDRRERHAPVAQPSDRCDNVGSPERDVVHSRTTAGRSSLSRARALAERRIEHEPQSTRRIRHTDAADQAGGVGKIEAGLGFETQYGAAEQHPRVDTIRRQAHGDVVDR